MSLPQTPPLKRLSRVCTAVLASVLLAAPAAAFDLDSDAPITVNAAHARLDDSQGVATYTGDVVVAQQGTRLSADKVVLYRDDQGLSRIEATGTPARYSQTTAGQTAATEASAERIIYNATESQLTFERNAMIEQSGNLFRGSRILYDTRNRVVTAEGDNGGNGEGRVEMVIQPRGRAQSDSN